MRIQSDEDEKIRDWVGTALLTGLQSVYALWQHETNNN